MGKNRFGGLRIVFYAVTVIVFIIGILLLTFAEPFNTNWAVGLGLVGLGIGLIIIKRFKKGAAS